MKWGLALKKIYLALTLLFCSVSALAGEHICEFRVVELKYSKGDPISETVQVSDKFKISLKRFEFGSVALRDEKGNIVENLSIITGTRAYPEDGDTRGASVYFTVRGDKHHLSLVMSPESKIGRAVTDYDFPDEPIATIYAHLKCWLE